MGTLTFDALGFGTGERRIAWDDVVAVGVRTTEGGPFVEDVFWQLLLRDGLIELPGSMLDGDDVGQLQAHLPGIDSREIAVAMGSCNERIFRVWHAEESQVVQGEASLRARFTALVARLGARGDAEEIFAKLHAAWSSSARRYHTVEHLVDCLRELDGARPEAADAACAELALWYHDAVYEPGAKDNESRSAARLLADAAAVGTSRAVAARAAEAVCATAAHGAGEGARGLVVDLVCDVDLAILGSDPLRFMEYEYAVCEELAALPRFALRAGRRRFLATLLESPIYRTAHFRARYEAKARGNVAALLRSPRYRPPRWLQWLRGSA